VSPTAAEWRYEVHLRGSRDAVAKHWRIAQGSVYQALPVIAYDHYRRGMMVNIGGVLAKKCWKCGVARELEHFWGNSASKSGCREMCTFCRSNR